MELETESNIADVLDDAAESNLTQLDEVLASLDENPDNVPLLRRQARLLRALDMSPAVVETLQRLAALVMLNEGEWLSYLDLLISTSPRPLSVESFLEIIEKFDQAERDYLSLAILLRHVDFILLCTATGVSDETTEGPGDRDLRGPGDHDLRDLLNEDTTREMLRSVIIRGNGLLSESHLLWQRLLDWEMRILRRGTESSRTDQISRIHSLYEERLRTPHFTMDQTLSSYSTFVSEWDPAQYEIRLVAATKLSQPAKHKYENEKRYGKHRSDFEQDILSAKDSSAQSQVFDSYIRWETDLRAKTNGTTDPMLSRAVFERAISLYAKAAASADTARAKLEVSSASKGGPGKKQTKKGKDRVGVDWQASTEEDLRLAEEAHFAYKGAEASVWMRYQKWMQASGTEEEVDDISRRAIRACPGSASLWIEFLSRLEQSSDDVNSAFENSIALGVFTAPHAPMTELVDLYLHILAFENRRYVVGDEPSETHPVLDTCAQAFRAIFTLDRRGDSTLRVEKFILEWAETRATHFIGRALELVKEPYKRRSSSYQYNILLAGVESRRGNFDAAGEIYAKAIQRSDLDWPEAVYEAFLRHELLHGTTMTMQATTAKIQKEEEKVLRRRAQTAREQFAQYQGQGQTEPPPMQSSIPLSEVTTETAELPETPLPAQSTDMAPSSGVTALKRDRENTTILVAGLIEGVETPQLEAHFSECGPIREVTLLPDSHTALVEFLSVDSVPTALAKDRKKFQGREISISMLWRSNLYITNFPPSMDDEALRTVFSPYGQILQTRWPSKKYNERRRFCYLTMDSPRAAQEALVLDGMQMDNFKLSVRISNPSIRKLRTDAVNTKLFISGLKSTVREYDIRELFKQYGTVVKVNLGWDEHKQACKGFAFVEMESEAGAKASLALNGSRHQNKRLQVQFPDTNITSKRAQDNINTTDATRTTTVEKRSRSVRLHHLPDGTQEGLLQQEIEKLVPVKRLEIFGKKREAVVELDSVADAGRLLMRPEGIMFNGASLRVTELGGVAPPQSTTAAENSTSMATAIPRSSLSFAPRPPKRIIGKGRQAPALDKSLPATLSDRGGPARAQDDFRAMVEVKNQQRREVLASKQDVAADSVPLLQSTGENNAMANHASPNEDRGSGRSKRNAEGDADHIVKRQKQDDL